MKSYLNEFKMNEMIDVLDELPFWSAPFGFKLLDFINYKKNITALDIGSGTGFPLIEIAMRLGNSSKVYGIDPWKEVLERIRKKINYYEINNVTLIESSAEVIPLDDESIDLITSNNGINNVTDIDKVISECSRIMKKDGQFVFTMNTELTMIEFYTQLESILNEMKMESEVKLMHQHILNKRPPIKNILSLLNKYGFQIKDLEQAQFNYRFADGTSMFNHYFIRLAFISSWIKLLPEDKVEEIFDKIETRFNEQSIKYGEIKLSVPYAVFNTIKM
ncbi:class I SAM-dependent methyltransferase [Rosettibacter firmus]|uniref:class I SAM-dependent methyltransferase n=1 Tax=Rosettibacter firmus TaxID=3111522 RepID=UPI00336BE742